MLHLSPATPADPTDAELVDHTLAGSREAFAKIVGRYQTLVCSVAYSATGDISRSQDLAQETFIAAWQRLSELRERGKLRAWLCGIAHNRINDLLRSQMREPIHGAEPLANATEATTPEASPSEATVKEDEIAIMWRSLRKIPEIYREPLILYYRENQSVEQVSAALGLTNEAVRQRLVRGRNFLQREVASLVEGALRRTAPGRSFTSGVMEAIPGPVSAAKAAVGVAGVTAGFDGVIAIVVKALCSPLTPLFVAVMEHRMASALQADSLSAEERAFWKRRSRRFFAVIIGMIVAMEIFGIWRRPLNQLPPYAFLIPAALSVSFVIWLVVRMFEKRRHLREIWARTGMTPVSPKWEFRSRRTFLGWPLIHIRVRRNPLSSPVDGPVKAWIAVGDIAYGRVLSIGAFAVAPVAFGLVGIGCFSAAACAVGGLAVGGYALGALAFGESIAIGWMAAGAIAIGGKAAFGIASYAHDFAGSPPLKRISAHAIHANDVAAKDFFGHSQFFAWAGTNSHDFRHHLLVIFFAGSAYALVWTVRVILSLYRRSVQAR